VRGIAAAAAAASLFGISAPAAKLLLSNAAPLFLGAVLYLGAGVGLTALRLVRRGRPREAPLRPSDLPLLLGVTAAGAVVAPVLLLTGLRHTTAVAASLALNLEGPFTIILAVLFFGEHVGAWSASGAVFVLLGAATLSLSSGTDLRGDLLGVLGVAGACIAWALDNNLTQRLSLRDPFAVAQAKGILGGGLGLVLALALGSEVPPARTIAFGLALGFASYGLSVVLAVYAMRLIGVAREASVFAIAPFVGVLVSVAVLGDPFGSRELAAMLLMLVGLVLLLRERHDHLHTHEALRHDHRHVHDEHHQHAHGLEDPPGEPHAHEHQHLALEHQHPHVPDIHHRHH
jgi:drug/metabolite transporter (DMT)-like permease